MRDWRTYRVEIKCKKTHNSRNGEIGFIDKEQDAHFERHHASHNQDNTGTARELVAACLHTDTHAHTTRLTKVRHWVIVTFIPREMDARSLPPTGH